MNTLKITVITATDTGYQEIVPLHFPRTWTYEERKDFVQRMGTVLRREIHIYESDKKAFESGITNQEREELWYQHTLREIEERDYWEAKDFHDARGDV